MSDVTYTAPEVCRIAGITYRQLDYWVREGLVESSVRDARGSGTQRMFSAEDAAFAQAVGTLLSAGASLQAIRRALNAQRVPEFVDELSEAGARLLAAVS